MPQRGRFYLQRVAAGAIFQVLEHLHETPVPRPGAEPSPDIASARNRRNIIELIQQIVARQRLHYPQSKRGAAYPAPGQAERASRVSVRPGANARECVPNLCDLRAERRLE